MIDFFFFVTDVHDGLGPYSQNFFSFVTYKCDL